MPGREGKTLFAVSPLINPELRRKKMCRLLRNAANDNQIEGLRSTGDLRGQVNDPKIEFGLLAHNSTNSGHRAQVQAPRNPLVKCQATSNDILLV